MPINFNISHGGLTLCARVRPTFVHAFRLRYNKSNILGTVNNYWDKIITLNNFDAHSDNGSFENYQKMYDIGAKGMISSVTSKNRIVGSAV
jgi:hypothetical protein